LRNSMASIEVAFCGRETDVKAPEGASSDDSLQGLSEGC
jgi:hypothetical protein